MNATPNPDPTRNPSGVVFLDRWVAAIRWISDLPHEIRLVCECLAQNADMNGEDCAPGNKLIAQDTGLSPSVVSESLKQLRFMRFIELVSDSHPPAKGPHLYRLMLRPDLEDVADEMVREGLHEEPFELPGKGKWTSLPVGAPIFPEASPNPRPVPSPVVRPAKAKRKGVRRQETVLYRYYDAEDVLLYVGVSANMPGRLEGHENDSTWMDFAARSTLEHFPDRAGAEAAEIAAIETDRPIFNILHNETPDRVRRIVDYLIDRDRRDLLVPLISRG